MKKSQHEHICVAQYLRMSTEHQRYSIENQEEYLKSYASQHNMLIKHTYNDAGKSGVTLSGRDGLKQLLTDVLSGGINIEAVLVYDVSRFGRFQDPDEAAHYSFLLKQHKVRVIYCAEPISDEYPEIAMLALPVLRFGAANYSKNLSDKVFLGQINLAKKGFRQGGLCGYGLRRLLIDENNKPKEILRFGQRKSIQSDRVILIPGPNDEVDVVNKIFDMFIFGNMPEFLIAQKLNESNIFGENKLKWTRSKVNQILTNEKYIGNNVYNKNSFKLKSKHIKNDESDWVRCENAYQPVIKKRKFLLAQKIIKVRGEHYSNENILAYLKDTLSKVGSINKKIIDQDDIGPSSSLIASRFGGLISAYKLIGYKPLIDYSYVDINQKLRKNKVIFLERIKASFNYFSCGTSSETRKDIIINGEVVVNALIAKCSVKNPSNVKWNINFNNIKGADILLVIRMDSTNKDIDDYYIFPSIEAFHNKLTLKQKNILSHDVYRFDDLSLLYLLLKPVNVREVRCNELQPH
ncbi:recombinase family protein [Pantoea sp.]|uniref:recombinase family protein n=1 Tax=Pantoea sp. TaxID=69393 RepID=UPI0028A5C72F|nr:recombinase family protein [Pantoea sp.]